MIKKIFSPKKCGEKIGVSLPKLQLVFFQKCDHSIGI
jgi:hypothetical protein